MMQDKEVYFELGIGTRLRRFYELMSTDADRIYEEAGLSFRVSYFYVVYALSVRGSMSIAEIAKLAGFSHSAVSQNIKKLIAEGIVETTSTKDGRQKLVSLSEKGKRMHEAVGPYWAAMEASMKDAFEESGYNLLDALSGVEGAFHKKSLYDRVHEKLERKDPNARTFTIEPFNTKYRNAFYKLNYEWLEKYFSVEPIDEKVLLEPEQYILDAGGEILFAVENGCPIGTVAMKMAEPGRFELTKLAVDQSARKGGIGAALCQAVIDRFKARGGKTLFLETNTVLENAIRLYWRLGFVEMPNPQPSPYERSNYYMEWQPAAEKIAS